MSRNLRFKDESELSGFLQKRGALTPQRADALAAAAGAKGSKKRQNKLGAQRIQHDGITFDSKHEGERYLLLKQRMRVGEIFDLVVHAPIACVVNGELVCTYIVDFSYRETINGVRDPDLCPSKYEDAKGHKRGATYALFRLKKRLVEVLHKITINEV